MKSKRLLSALFVLLFCVYSNGDGTQDTIEYDINCYILGTISDYMDRNIFIDSIYNSAYVQSYSLMYYCIANKIDSLLKEYNLKNNHTIDYQFIRKDAIKTETNNSPVTLCSKELYDSINRFYSIDTSGSNRTLLKGRLKSAVFANKKQEFSFLAGAFAIEGIFNNGNYGFKIANSSNKLRLLVNTLKKHSIDTMQRSQSLPKSIPFETTLYFKPSKELMQYLKPQLELARLNSLKISERKKVSELCTISGNINR